MISLVILWHMHQPEYADPNTGEYALPWTRLHAVKDYDEMADVMAGHPDIHTTVNLTPVLCEQIDAMAGGRKDLYWSLAEKPASYLTLTEREFILTNFFKANFETMIRPYERYAELFFERGRAASRAQIHEAANSFSAQKIRDLQVWANLAWSSESLRENDPVIRELLAKGRQFTEDEKLALLGVHRRILGGVLDKYRKLQEDGIIEISTTPYYHPILPLLLEMKDSQVANPGRPLPDDTRPFLEDARWHVEAAQLYMERRMGRRPNGMWPAEGSVSEKTGALLASCKVRWAATDELILKRSLRESGKSADNGALNRVYRYESSEGPIHLFFRNHDLSDRIGFNYASMPTKTAAENFLEQVKHTEGTDAVVSVILDGENAWEFYRTGSCRTFLTGLFSALKRETSIATRTCQNCLDADTPTDVLPRLTPGSWINGNFDIWIGHSEDNAGWDAVQKVRKAVERMTEGPAKDKAARLLRITEGSDWYWWFGDDHSSQDDLIFDSLFRENLAAICKLAGAPVPPEIRDPIKKVHVVRPTKQPTEAFTPTVDGVIRPFYEWMGAGAMDVNFMAGTMHRAVYHLQQLFWGFDEATLYLCLQMADLPEDILIRILFRTGKGEMEAQIPSQAPGQAKLVREDGECFLTAAMGEVLEVAIPLDVVRLEADAKFSIAISFVQEGMEIERWPAGANLELFVPDESFFSTQWIV